MHFNEEILALASIITREKMLEEMLHLAGEVPFLRAVRDAGTSSEEEEEEECPEAQPQEEEERRRGRTERQAPGFFTSQTSSHAQEMGHTQEPEKSSFQHKMRKCQIPGCCYYVPNLPRHVNVHVKRGKVAQEDTQRMREIPVASNHQRGAPVKDS